MGTKKLFNSIAVFFSIIIFSSALHTTTLYAQAGKINGTVTDANGEVLPGVNIIIDGTLQGASSSEDGFFQILNVKPGIYSLRATYIGFASIVIENVNVAENLTTEVNFTLQEQTIEGEEIVVTAVQPVVRPDVSASVTSIQAQEIASLPVTDVASVIGLGAGIRGTSVRGGSSSDLEFSVNGISQRSTRSNSASQEISFTSLNSVQVQTGGFNAEYGNIQSGLISVTTKEGDREKYNMDVIFRLLPPQDKHFGPDINDPMANPFLRPYLDPEVAFTGTGENFQEGAWDYWTRIQYPQFRGWNAVSEELLADDDPTNDLTPYAAQRLFRFQHRKELGITEPDYELDATISGPVPGIGESLGNLRFAYSTRATQRMYIVPLSRDRYEMNYHLVKLTSDVASGMKLSVEGSYRYSTGTNASRTGASASLFGGSASSIAGAVTLNERSPAIMFSSDYFNPLEQRQFVGGLHFTHSLTDNSFYEVRAIVNHERFDGLIGQSRDLNENIEFADGQFTNEAPFGYYGFSQQFIGSGLNMGLGFSNARDTTRNTLYNVRADFTSQVNRVNLVKAGIDFQLIDNKTNNARIDQFLTASNLVNKWDTRPMRLSAYVQDKLEFEGMIANIGLRMDYVQGQKWYAFSDYDASLGIGNAGIIDTLQTITPDGVLRLSPRLGVSFPITEVSKFYFNYGHFYRLPTPDDLYYIRVYPESQQVTSLANPDQALPKTVAYELGYEQSLFDQYLIKVAGFYRDVTDQPLSVTYTNRDASVNYSLNQANRYSDIRGVELTFRKSQGRYVRGFANYTYQVSRSGRFGFARSYENPAQQREYERTTTANDVFPSVPQPYANVSLEFLVPQDLGPSFAGFYPIGGWNVNFIYRWTSGAYESWTGGGFIPGIVNNVQWKDYWNVDLRLSKHVELADRVRASLFVDVNNVLNHRYFSPYTPGFVLSGDRLNYMRSLHLPEGVLEEIGNGYPSPPIAGNDKPGDYRDFDVEFVPIVSVINLETVANPNERPLYWHSASQDYYQYDKATGTFNPADNDYVKEVLDTKAYIDMPNQPYFTFFNPRAVRYGVRISF